MAPTNPAGSPALAALVAAYGRPMPPPVPGRYYWGWRTVTVVRRELEDYAPLQAQTVLDIFGGRRPIHAASVKPVKL